MLRAVTLSDLEVKRAIEDGWFSSWHNQCPGLYCNNTADTRVPIPYPPEQLATVREGAGGGNIRFYFCDADGRVVHYVAGFVGVDRFLDEQEFARNLIAHPAEAKSLRADRKFRESWGIASWDEVQRGATHRRMLNLDSPTIGRPVAGVLRETEDDVYLKGAIG